MLNKADLHADRAGAAAAVETIAAGAPVVVLSAFEADSPAALAPWLQPGQTLALLGSSGVGKSTLINQLLGREHQATGAISTAVNKGRHTTTHRELLVLPGGALVIDTPGLRELQLWEHPARGLDATFADLTDLASACRFRDCTHGGEPGCAVQAALADGTLAIERWQSFQKLRREAAHAARKADPRLAREQKAVWKRIHRAHRHQTRHDVPDVE